MASLRAGEVESAGALARQPGSRQPGKAHRDGRRERRAIGLGGAKGQIDVEGSASRGVGQDVRELFSGKLKAAGAGVHWN